MTRSPTAAFPPLVTSLALTSAARRNGSAERGERDDPGPEASRVARLWEAIRRTRLELEARERRDDWIGARFEALIRPRERAFTSAICQLTGQLVGHHERTLLGSDERALLGLWIDENLRSLATHPFAPRETADALARRWQRHLGTFSHPLDASLASLHAREGRDPFYADHEPAGDGDDDPASRPRAARDGRHRDAESRRRTGRPDGDGGRGGARNGTTDHASDDGSGTFEDVARRDPDRLVSRLFRRLARVLHPDREPNEARRRDKHALMSECLRARDERDIDTLLSLYVEHVGALPEDIVEDDPAELVRLLRHQLGVLQRRLRRRLAGGELGGELGAMIVERYAANERGESERRFAAHARALDGETARVDALGERIGDAGGLREALRTRRERELDRLAIDELTGVALD